MLRPAQMLESRDMTNVPVIVAANKMDRVTTADAVAIRERKDIVHLVKPNLVQSLSRIITFWESEPDK